MAIAALSILLQAKTDKFDRRMKRSRSQVAMFGSSVNSMKRLLIGAAGAFAAFASVRSLTGMVKEQLSLVDATSKLADRLNIATEALVGFQHAASIGGASAEDLNKGIERMARSLGEAADGLTTPIRSLEAMGLTLEQLQGLNTEEQFLTISDAISKIEDPTMRAVAAYGIFGRKGQELLNTLMMGRAGLQGMRAEAEALGITFTREMGAKAEMANDSLQRLSQVGVGLARNFAVELSPAIIGVSNRLVEMSKSTLDTHEIAINSVEGIVTAVAYLANAFRVLTVPINMVRSTIFRLGGAMTKVVAAFAWGLAKIGAISEENAAYINGLGDGLLKEGKRFQDEVVKVFTEPMPSGEVRKFFDRVRQEADEASRKIAESARRSRQAIVPDYDTIAEQFGLFDDASPVAEAVDQVAEQADAVVDTFSEGMVSAAEAFNDHIMAPDISRMFSAPSESLSNQQIDRLRPSQAASLPFRNRMQSVMEQQLREAQAMRADMQAIRRDLNDIKVEAAEID